MKKLLYTLLALSIIFSACQKDEDPTTLSTDYITDCNIAEFDITFSGTNFWDSENGWFNIDGTESYCFKTLDPNSPNINNPTEVDFEVMNHSDLQVSNHFDGTKNLSFWFEDNFDWDIFRIQVSIVDIGSIQIGQVIQTSGGARLGGKSQPIDCEISMTLTTIDTSNDIYEGNMSCNFGPDEWINYEPGTAFGSAIINDFHFTESPYDTK